MANLHDTDYQIKFKQGLFANVSTTATLNSAITGEPHYTTDTKDLYVFDGSAMQLIGGASLGGLYIKKSPISITDNTITIPNATYKGLVIKGATSQSANLTEWQNSSATILSSVDANGKLGIGTSDPDARFSYATITSEADWSSPNQVVNSATILHFRNNAANPLTTGGGGLIMGFSGGTKASPTTVANTERLGFFLASGYDGTTWQNPVGFNYYVDGAVSTGVVPGRIELATGTSTASRTARMIIYSGGNILIPNATASVIPFTVKGAVSQTANLTEWKNSSNTILSGVQARGTLFSNLGTNTTNLFLGDGAGNPLTTGLNCVALGYLALQVNDNSNNLAIGSNSFYKNISGTRNVGVGSNTGSGIEAGDDNVFIGNQAGYANALNVTGVSNNVNIGSNSGRVYTDNTVSNTAIGSNTAFNLTGNYNVLIGTRSGYNLTSGESNVFLGFYSGYRQTTNSNLLIIDNTIRANTTVESTNCIIYGVMAASPTDQSLSLNATVKTMGRKQAVATKSTDYTLTDNDEVIVFTTTATATLPAATGSGQTYRIICRAGTLTIDGNGTDLVKGELTQELYEGEDLILTDTETGYWE
jgi:hypothetical protein